MKKLLVIVSLLILTGCKKEVNDVDKVIEEGNYVVVDVRTKDEYDTGHVVDSLLIPYDTIDENVNLDKDKTILVYCRSGRRSNIAKQELEKLGYTVIDLGGYDEVTLDKE